MRVASPVVTSYARPTSHHGGCTPYTYDARARPVKFIRTTDVAWARLMRTADADRLTAKPTVRSRCQKVLKEKA